MAYRQTSRIRKHFLTLLEIVKKDIYPIAWNKRDKWENKNSHNFKVNDLYLTPNNQFLYNFLIKTNKKANDTYSF